MAQCVSAIFFSATLVPLEYFKRVILNNSHAYQVVIPSPFPPENLGIFIHGGISTKYIHREQSSRELAGVIRCVVSRRPGNYLVFFPSYAYMEMVAEQMSFEGAQDNLRLQEKGMSEEEKELFLNHFKEEGNSPVTALAVMGGSFGEGIDLTGNKLIGVIVVGVGLPMICLERDIIRQFFMENGEDGFAFAYQLPGLNRVMQAAGRVIRSETDRGVVVLIDERFTQYRYTALYPPEWGHFRIHSVLRELPGELSSFWRH